MKFFSTFSSLFLMRLLESRPWWGPEMAGLLKCSPASSPKAMVCTHSTEWCLRSHLSNSAHVSRLRVFVEMAFKGSQPCASNQDSSPGHSHRNSDNTMNHGTSGESQQNKRWDGIIWLSHTPCHTPHVTPGRALAACICGKHTKVPEHSCLPLWREAHFLNRWTRGDFPFTTFKARPVSTGEPANELTNKTINFSYLERENWKTLR